MKVVIEPQFDGIADQGFDNDGFRDGLAAVKVGVTWGFIDHSGRFRIPPRFEAAQNFSEGLAAVRQAGLYGYIDQSSNWIISPRFRWIGPRGFREGVAVAVKANESRTFTSRGNITIPASGFINTSGQFVIQPQYYHAEEFSSGLSLVQQRPGKGQVRFIDKSGRTVIAPVGDTANRFAHGWATIYDKCRPRYMNPAGKYFWRSEIKVGCDAE